MKRSDIYIGQIGIVDDIEYSEEAMITSPKKILKVYQSVCPLYKIDDNHYINLNWINTPSHILRIIKSLMTNDYSDELIIGTEPLGKGELFVIEDTLIQYYKNNLDKVISKRKIRNDMLMDVRIPGGVEH